MEALKNTFAKIPHIIISGTFTSSHQFMAAHGNGDKFYLRAKKRNTTNSIALWMVSSKSEETKFDFWLYDKNETPLYRFILNNAMLKDHFTTIDSFFSFDGNPKHTPDEKLYLLNTNIRLCYFDTVNKFEFYLQFTGSDFGTFMIRDVSKDE